LIQIIARTRFLAAGSAWGSREDFMQVRYDRSTGQSTTPDEGADLLQCRFAIVGLDINAIERNYSDVFGNLRRRCISCTVRAPCAVDLKRDPNNLVWEAYCPNSAALNALVALTELIH
jgi:hypothetical protein